MATTFQQGRTDNVSNFTGYAWSDASNWTNGVPVNGSNVVFNQGITSNPDGYDDIANLYLDNLTLTQGYLAVTGNLQVGTVTFSADVGEIYTTTFPGNSSALLTIDGFAGTTGGLVEAVGAGAVTNVLATTDPGETYYADEGGEIELTALPNASSQLEFGASVPNATIALRTAGTTISAALEGVTVGESIALPGSSVSAVTFSAHSLSITTNLGTTTFSNVSYGTTTPTGYTVSTDPTGLERITFTTAKSTTFQQGQTSSVNNFTGYAWSDASNWTNGVPVNGSNVVFNQGTTSNPDGYDDIANLYLDNLTLTQGYLAVTGNLQVGTVTFSADVGEIYTTTFPGNSSALLTIDGFAGTTGGLVEAVGAGAVTNVLATTDPGETYYADEGGEIELTALPNAASQLEFGASVPNATIALRTAGTTISAALEGVTVGESIALPGSSVSAVTFSAHALTITTNLGTTTFSNVSYGTTTPTGYTVSTDPTGLERITFTTAKSTTFQQGRTDNVGNFTGYAWSDASNWSNGVPVNGSNVVFNQGITSNPDGYDDIANLYLDNLTLTQGYLAVTGNLQVGTVTFSADIGEIYTTTFPGNSSALLTIDGFAGTTGGLVEAVGAGAVTNVLATTDPGETYYADEGGEIELTSLPNAASQLEFGASVPNATIALRTAGTTISAALEGVTVGESIALPGTSVSSVTFGAHALTITTNLGTTTFSNVSYGTTTPTGYTVSTDPTGLERITFTTAQSTTFQQSHTDSFNGFTTYEWSDSANWSNGMPVNGANVTFNQGITTNPDGLDDIANLYLDNLTVTQGYLAVAGNLQVGTVTFSSAIGEVYANTLLGNSSALLTIDGFAGSGGGIVEAVGAGAVTNVLATSDPGETYYASQGGEIELTALSNASSQLEFGSSATIALRTAGTTISAALEFVTVGDAIALPGTSVSSVTFGAHALTITTNLGTTTFSNVSYGTTTPTGYTVSTDPTGLERITFTELTCYVAGTKILTSDGERAVEDLQIGDSLQTLHAGYQKIKWIGTSSFDGRFIKGDKAALPICIKQDALGTDMPARDLFVSPGHAICIDGVLVQAARLVNGVSVVQAARVDKVTYYHIEMETHEIIFAENCPAETFLGENFRQWFQNAAQFAELYPGEVAPEITCLPLLDSGFQLHAIQQRIAARAGIDVSAAPELGPLRGYVDQAGPKLRCGWVQDTLAPEQPVCLDITADGRIVGRVLANLYRADLYKAGFGSGCHGFEFILPPGTTGRIDAVRTADRARLEWTESAAVQAA